MTSPPLMVSDVFCATCGVMLFLYAVINAGPMCAGCWKRAGRPFPAVRATAMELHAAELATRERMQQRGGADRHMVRSGKS